MNNNYIKLKVNNVYIYIDIVPNIVIKKLINIMISRDDT
jgi:hypothetical protein